MILPSGVGHRAERDRAIADRFAAGQWQYHPDHLILVNAFGGYMERRHSSRP